MLTSQSMAMNLDMWHVEKTSKPNTFCLQLCILLKYYSVQKLHHHSKTIHLIGTPSDTHFTTGKPFSTQFSPWYYSIPQLIWKVSFLLICSFLLELQDCYASQQSVKKLVCLESTALPLNTASSLTGLHLFSQDRSSSAED